MELAYGFLYKLDRKEAFSSGSVPPLLQIDKAYLNTIRPIVTLEEQQQVLGRWEDQFMLIFKVQMK